MEVVIKPHHFMDIIKLYGSGINEFVPDLKMQHDFYRVANMIIHNPATILKLTTGGDDICRTCLKYRTVCVDTIDHRISKDEYNRYLDQKIIELYQLTAVSYTAKELCQIYAKHPEYIYLIWKNENRQITKRRYEMFIKGANKFLSENRVKGFGYCGLACDYCHDGSDCPGCKAGGCLAKDECKNYQCCHTNGYQYCFECPQFPCFDSILKKLRVRTFCQFIKEYGEDALSKFLLNNSQQGILYHYSNKHLGDYDQFNNSKDIVDFIKQGYLKILGQQVTVIVDRPLGTFHPKHPDLYYPINYGYIDNIIAGDNEMQDAYIIGVNEPLTKFTGEVIAIVRRFDDDENKWVVARAGTIKTKSEIEQAVMFQEQFFKHDIIIK